MTEVLGPRWHDLEVSGILLAVIVMLGGLDVAVVVRIGILVARLWWYPAWQLLEAPHL